MKHALRKEKDLRLLKRRRAEKKANSRLFRKLMKCSKEERCGSGACVMCVDKVSANLRRAIRRATHDKEVAVVTISTPASTADIGDLATFDHANHARRLRHLFRDLPFEWGLFVTDFSENEHRTGRYDPFWCVHYHGLLVGSDIKVLRRVLAKRCAHTDEMPRPFNVKPWDRDDRALRYLLGLEFDRRIGFDDGTRFDPKTGEWRTCRDVRDDELRVAQRLELLLHLHDIGVDSRITMLRAQLRQTDDGLIVVPMRQSASWGRYAQFSQFPKGIRSFMRGGRMVST